MEKDWFPRRVSRPVLRFKRPLHHFNASRELKTERWYPRQESHLILLLRREVCVYYTTRTSLRKLAPHAGYAPTPTVRQTVMLLLQQWGICIDHFGYFGSSISHTALAGCSDCLEIGSHSGVAPGPPVLQAGALLRELSSRSILKWSSYQVTLLGLPVINRALCY